MLVVVELSLQVQSASSKIVSAKAAVVSKIRTRLLLPELTSNGQCWRADHPSLTATLNNAAADSSLAHVLLEQPQERSKLLLHR